MATLTNKTVASTYNLLLKVKTDSLDGSVATIQDGVDNDSALMLSTDAVKVMQGDSSAADLDVTGDTTVGGTLEVTGITSLTGLIDADGGIAVDTNKFTVAGDGTGDTLIAGALVVNGGITCEVDKFTVADTTGNTAVAGTLGVTELITATAGTAGDVLASNGTSTVLDSGTDGTDASFTGDIKDENGDVIITSGASAAASSIADGVTATTQTAGTADTTIATTAYADTATAVRQIVQVVVPPDPSWSYVCATAPGPGDLAINGMELEITPKGTGNNVLIELNVVLGNSSVDASGFTLASYSGLLLYRDTVEIGQPSVDGDRHSVAVAVAGSGNSNPYNSVTTTHFAFLDTTGTTEETAVTYKVYMSGYQHADAGTFYLGWSGVTTDDQWNIRANSTITLTEVSA